MTAITPKKIRPGYEPIAGYVLEELLGRGGFGEVWRAEAPGGIKKAVKFVFGDRDEHRAEQELKSLERIKGVQHPFILTLERFEIVNDRLVIVTELADGSLDDIFKDRRRQGSCGIARSKLLNYMGDTADALDYLHDLYKLQHLDIKPANLLIVGGRVKVADFGLLKDLGDIECSVIGGLTPIYAPPELFDGRPSMHSDQYSLAVMYQELLTGTRPFSGRTIAQLATQHIHNAPNLKPLPPSDRPVIARALEKSPSRRFANCSEFVDALLNERDVKRVSQAPSDQGDASAEVQDLPQAGPFGSVDQHSAAGRALVVGLGGTGSDCVRLLRDRVSELRSMSPLFLHSVVIDIDSSTSVALDDELSSEFLPYNQSLTTPLRTAHEYRERGTGHLKSMSRRWLYNVPRSGKTEGMRPLGRLALVDHAAEVTAVLREAIVELVKSSDGRPPRIYLVGSLAGGTGSGMFIDVAYLVRGLLDDVGLHETEVMSLMTAARMQGDPSRPLVLHNTNAAIKEIMYFLKPGNSYPGDPGAKLPGMPAARTPLHSTYLLAESQVSRAPSAVETLVDYLWIDSTGAGPFLESARQFDHDVQDTAAAQPSLRSVGVVQLSGTRRLEENVLAPSTARQLLRKWLGNPERSLQLAQPLVERLARRCELSVDEILNSVLQSIGKDEAQRREHVESQLRNAGKTDFDDESISEFVRSILKADENDTVADGVISTMQREMAIRLIDGKLDFAASIKTAQLMASRVRQIADQLDDHAEEHADRGPQSAQDRCEAILRSFAFTAARKRAQHIRERLNLCEQRLAIRAMTLAKAIRSVNDGKQGGASAWDDMNEPLREQFEPVIKELHGVCAPNWLVKLIGDSGGTIKPQQLVEALCESAVPLICRAVMSANGTEMRESHATDVGVLSDASPVSETSRFKPADIGDSIRATATLTRIKADLGNGGTGETRVLTIEEAIEAVQPTLLCCGGFQRLMLIVGSQAEKDVLLPQVQQHHEGSLTTCIIDSAPPMLVHEAQRIVIDDISRRLTTLAGGDDQISRRLNSRSDIDW